jgi:copper homeostasis protein
VPGILPVEIAVQDVAGVRIALEAGAARVELCQALEVGGLTPSAALVEAAVEAAAAASAPAFVHVLVRPRGGGFVYDADELDQVVRDIRFARALGAAGVVIGALTDAGALDRPAIERFRAAADDVEVTVHRAVDAAAVRRRGRRRRHAGARRAPRRPRRSCGPPRRARRSGCRR